MTHVEIVLPIPASQRTAADYTNELVGFAKLVNDKWGVEPYWVCYSGGVPGMQAKLPEEQYDDIKAWLDEIVGAPPDGADTNPSIKARWHPEHRVNQPVFEYKFTPEMLHLTIDHCYLIRMHTLKAKRYTLLSWM